MSKYIYWVKKRLVWVILDRKERGDDNKTSLKEGGIIEMSSTVLPLRDARSLRFEYLPSAKREIE